MPVLTDYLSRRGEFLVLALVVVASVALMMLSAARRDTIARALGDGALTPLQVVIDRSLDIRALKAENDSLRAALARSTHALGELRERDREAAALRTMLGFREASRWDLVAARVVAREAARAGREYKIDRGREDGVEENQAVMTVRGLVGRITRVTERSAWVRPIVARGCQVSARVVRTRTDGILAWTRQLGLHLAFVPFRAEVAAGDSVITSGLGGVFPRGIPIGEVTRTETLATLGTLRVFVKPAVEFSALEAVFVVRKSTDAPPIGAAEPAGLPRESDPAPVGNESRDEPPHTAADED